jgi:hypothetical protein
VCQSEKIRKYYCNIYIAEIFNIFLLEFHFEAMHRIFEGLSAMWSLPIRLLFLQLLHFNIVLLLDMAISIGILKEIGTKIKLYNTNSTVIYLGLFLM